MKHKEIKEFFDAIFPTIKQLIEEEVKTEFLIWTKGIATHGDWCCRSMKDFAKRHWDINEPIPKSSMGWSSIIFKFYSNPINYCPFCGRKL